MSATQVHSDKCIQRDQGDIEGDKISDVQLQQKENDDYLKKGRYGSKGQDRHPNIPVSQVLLFPSKRSGRILHRKSLDTVAHISFGDPIIYKDPLSTRFMFQNVKGMTYSTGCEDYKYFLSAMMSYSVDLYGMAETNTGWQHNFLQSDFRACVRRQFQYGKTVFGYPSPEIDHLPIKETFQAGGTLQVVRGNLTTQVFGPPIQDASGLGRWCGTTFIGKVGQKYSVLSGYRTCAGSFQTAPLGSTYRREYEYFKEKGHPTPQPRSSFLKDMSRIVHQLRDQNHAILLMMDANSTMEKDKLLQDFVA